jgi:N-acetylneuraminic acid mutarotase
VKETVVGRVLCVAAGVLLLAACAPGLVVVAARPAATSIAPAASPDPGFGGGVVPQSGDGSLRGVWSQLPRSPLSDRDGANVAWTGRYLFVWGGSVWQGTHGPKREVLRGDGAVWDLPTGRWRVLPPSPLSARAASAVVWTGRQVIVWGGYDRAEPRRHVSAEGAAWNPTTNTWTKLPPAPLRARSAPIATWTGRRMVLLGGYRGPWTRSYPDGASFDPATGTWRKLPAARSPDGHPIDWRAAVMTDHDLFAWSTWSPPTPGSYPTAGDADYYRRLAAGGGEMYRYDPDTDRWSLVRHTQQSPQNVRQALWTGQDVIVQGEERWCGSCGTPVPQPDVTRIYRPATDTWIGVPPDPNFTGRTYAWAGGLFSLRYTTEASAWNPTTNTWTRLPPTPYACLHGGQQPAFLGDRVGYWCPQARTGPAANHDGLVYTLTPAAPTGRGPG